jgi:predicted outer membrane repeat protein
LAVDVNNWASLLSAFQNHSSNEVINITANITASGDALNGAAASFIMQSNVSGTQRTLFGQGYRGFRFVSGSSATFKDINFQQFVGNDDGGAAIRVDNSANLFFFGRISFINNTGGYHGGAVRIRHSQSSVNFINAIVDFNDNKREPIMSDAWGAAINITDGKLYFINSTVYIRNTKAYSSALFPGENGTITTVTFSKTTVFFDANYGVGNGGAIHVYHNAYLTFDRSSITFSRNSNPTNGIGEGGGAIFLGWDQYKYMAFKNSTVNFHHNYSTGSGAGTGGAGAAIYFRGYGDVIFENSSVTFSYNTAGYAAVFFINALNYNSVGPSKFTFKNSNLFFTGNTSYLPASNDLAGGVIFAQYVATNPGSLNFENIGRFVANNNRVFYGDGGFFFSNTASKFDFQGSLMEMKNNVANSGRGGAIFMRRSFIRLSGSSIVFANNTAGTLGGAFSITDISSITLSASSMTFEGNRALGGPGGAIYFENSAVGNFAVAGSITFSRNVSVTERGGAMYFPSGTSVTFASNWAMRYQYNTAFSSGGAMYFDTPAGAYFKNIRVLEFTGNTALNGTGGGMAFRGLPNALNFTPSSMSFTSNTARINGGGMNFIGATVSFASVGVEPSSMSFIYNRAMTGRGGAMYFESSSVTFAMNQQMIFDSNIAASSGGAMYFQNARVAYFQQTRRLEFNSNTAAAGAGGGMYFSNVPLVNFAPASMTFSNNTSSLSGGGMYFSGASVTFAAALGVNSSMSFTSNTAGLLGGAMYFDGSSVTFAMNQQMLFRWNIAASSGGAIYFQNARAAYFQQTRRLEFIGNTSTGGAGGGMYFSNVPVVIFEPASMTFSSNTAAMSGGGMYFSGSSVIFAAAIGVDSSMSFTRNMAGVYGGAMYFDGSSVTFAMDQEMIFRWNIAGSSGGAMYFQDSLAAYFRPTKTLDFTSNTTRLGSGGAMYFAGTPLVTFEPNILIFNFNTSAISGGGMYFNGSAIEFRAGSAISFKNNVSSMSGGAMHLVNSTAVFSGSGLLEADGNKLLALGKSSGNLAYLDRSTMIFEVTGTMSFRNHIGAYAAVLYGTNDSYIKFTSGNVIFENNSSQNGNGIISWDRGTSADFIDLKVMTITNNEALWGGFLYIANAGFAIEAAGFRASGNKAVTGNGGVFYFNASTFIFSAAYSTFTNNIANLSGGAIYLSAGSSAEFRSGGAAFISNSALFGSGAAVYAAESSRLIFNSTSTFTNNISRLSGGAIYLSAGSSAEFRSGSAAFISNSALSGSGAAIYAAGKSRLLFNSTVNFTNNSAQFAGGGIFLERSIIQVGGSLGLYSNRASSGAGIYIQGSTLTSVGVVTLSNNVAGLAGGGIYVVGVSSVFFITTGIFTSNSAQFGGGMYLDKSTVSGNLEFNRNSARYGGGAYVSVTSLGFTRTDIKFSSNTAAVVSANGLMVGRGGALYMVGSSLAFTGSTISFISNRLSNGASRGMGAGMGAYLREGSLLNLNGGFLRVIDQGRLIFRADGSFERKNEDGVFYLEDDKSDVILMGANIEAISNGYINDDHFYGKGGFFEFNGDGGAGSSLTFTAGYFNLVSNEGKRGGAIYADRYNLTFNNNITGGLSTMVFINNTASIAGGAIYLNKSTLTFKNQRYIGMAGNRFDAANAVWRLGRFHGANTENDIYLENGSVLTFDVINIGTASLSGGIYARDGNIINKTGRGVLYLSGVNYFDNISSFGVIGMGSVLARGGEWTYIYNKRGIYVATAVFRVEGADILFQNNTSIYGGGGIDLRTYSYSVISSSAGLPIRFINNTSQKLENITGFTNGGGTINIIENSTMVISGGNIEFSANEALRQPGYRVPRVIEDRGSASNIAVGNYYFLPADRGEARVRGGAIYIKGASLEISGRRYAGVGGLISFIGNVDETGLNDIYMDWGGKLNIKNGDGRVEINDGIYADAGSIINVLKDGAQNNGLLYMSGYNYFVGVTSFGVEANTLVDKATFTYITNDKPFFVKAASAVFQWSKVDFVKNTTPELGGALRAIDGSYVEFTMASWVNFIENSAYSGGAIYAYNGSTVLFTAQARVRFDGNLAASSGGVIYADHNSYVGAFLYSDLCEFLNHTVGNVGGAIDINDNSTLILREIDVLRAADNRASSGGFLYVSSASKAIFDGNDLLIFERNTAEQSGGVIYATDRSSVYFVNIKHLDVLNNRSIRGDGVFYSERNSRIIFDNVYNVKAQDNASVNGGFMAIKDSIFTDYGFSLQAIRNTAIGGNGGAISIVNADADFNTISAILDTEFYDNMAMGLGGAIYIEDSTVNIKALAYNTYFGTGGRYNRELGGQLNDINIRGNSQLNLVSAFDKVIEFASGIKASESVYIDKTGYGDTIFGGIIQIRGSVDVEDGYLTMKTEGVAASPHINNLRVSKYAEFRTFNDIGQYKVYVGSLELAGTLGIGVDTTGNQVRADYMRFNELSIGAFSNLDLFWTEFEPVESTGIKIIEALRIRGGYFSNYPGNGYEVKIGEGPFSSIYKINYGNDGAFDYISLDMSRRYNYGGMKDLTPNESEAARWLDAMKDDGSMSSVFSRLTAVANREHSSGADYSNTKWILGQLTGKFLPNVLAANALGNTGRLYSKIVYEEGIPADESGVLQLVWVEGDYGGGYYSGQNADGAEEFRNEYSGITAGFPLWRGKNDLGVYGSFSDKSINQAGNTGRIEDVEGGIYIGHYGESINIKGHLGISKARNEAERLVSFLDYAETAHSAFDTINIRFGAEIEYQVSIDTEAKAKPFIGVTGGIVLNNDITEDYGNALNLSIAEDKYARVDIIGGLKIEDSFGLYHWNIKGYGGYIVEGEKPVYQISFTNMAGSVMEIEGIELSKLYGGLSAWIEYRLSQKASFFVNADFNYGKDNINYYGNMGIKYHIGGRRQDVRDVKEANKKRQEGIKEVKESKINIAACEFDLGEYEINEKGRDRIWQIAQEIKKLKWTRVTAKVRLNIANPYNDDRYYLALERAKAVYEELYLNGIDIEGLDYEVEEFVGSNSNRGARDNGADNGNDSDEYNNNDGNSSASVYSSKENIAFIEIEYLRN